MKREVIVCVVSLMVGLSLGGDNYAAPNIKAPNVYVYSRKPIKIGEENELICHCNGFHPPRIDMELTHNGQKYEKCQQSDMSFKNDWAYFTTTSIKFTPEEGVIYRCNVRHNDGQVKSYVLDPLM